MSHNSKWMLTHVYAYPRPHTSLDSLREPPGFMWTCYSDPWMCSTSGSSKLPPAPQCKGLLTHQRLPCAWTCLRLIPRRCYVKHGIVVRCEGPKLSDLNCKWKVSIIVVVIKLCIQNQACQLSRIYRRCNGFSAILTVSEPHKLISRIVSAAFGNLALSSLHSCAGLQDYANWLAYETTDHLTLFFWNRIIHNKVDIINSSLSMFKKEAILKLTQPYLSNTYCVW